MQPRLLTLTINDRTYTVAAAASDVLLDLLRETLGLTGTKRGCDFGTCGCCTVLIDGEPRLSCLTLAHELAGQPITTIEGLRRGEDLHPLQREFAEQGGSQCGFCTPGFIMTAAGFLARHPSPSRDQVKKAIAGNLCRCTGYLKIVSAIEQAALELPGWEAAHPPSERDGIAVAETHTHVGIQVGIEEAHTDRCGSVSAPGPLPATEAAPVEPPRA